MEPEREYEFGKGGADFQISNVIEGIPFLLSMVDDPNEKSDRARHSWR